MTIERTLEALLGQPVVLGDAVGGGDIAQPKRGRTEDGRDLFIKSARGMPRGWVEAEATGLQALAAADSGIGVPEVLARSDIPPVLVLEWIEPGVPDLDYWRALGRGLATQHRVRGEGYGFPTDGFIGRTPQLNAQNPSWPVFFRDQRLHPLHRRLVDAGLCSEVLSRDLDRICAQIEALLPEPSEGPVLLHGDLWSGNVMPDSNGRPVTYDPAVYWGGREADVAMTRLFGGFDDVFYEAYEDGFSLEPGHRERVPLLNLYHLLNHALLFGGGYTDRCEAVASSYA